jgi:YidC/Oxa1 family membrane protein insertase
MEKRSIIGMALIAIVLVLWSTVFRPKKQDQDKEVYVEEPKQEQMEVKESVAFGQDSSDEKDGNEEILDSVDTDLARIVISRTGASIRSVRLKKYKSVKGDWVELIPENEKALSGFAGETDLSDWVFTLSERQSDDPKAGVDGRYLVYESNGIRKTYSFNDSSYVFDLTIELPEMAKHTVAWGSGLATTERDQHTELRYFGGIVRLGGTVILKQLNSLDTIPKGEPGTIEWAGVKNKYFLAATIPLTETENYRMSRANLKRVSGGGCMRGCMPVGDVDPEDVKVKVSLTTQAEDVHKFKIYVGPLDYDILKKVGFGIEDACYFGFKWIRPISRLFLKVLLGLYSVIPNYGVVIIIFSVMIGVIFFPLQRTSQRSAMEMQRMQPKISELKKKYAKDAKKLNQATMELYRKQKVSPVSGCLPLFIQMPVFFALYAILDTTIALRGAVFVPGWIEDLSQPDSLLGLKVPILPIFMGGMMFLQQRMQSRGAATSQMQQQQKMMMYFMPIMFTFIFLRFPAGLVLYWFVYNIFSFVQTYMLKSKLAESEALSKQGRLTGSGGKPRLR